MWQKLQRKFTPWETIIVCGWLAGYCLFLIYFYDMVIDSDAADIISPDYGHGHGWLFCALACLETHIFTNLVSAMVSFMFLCALAPLLGMFNEILVINVPKVATIIYPDGRREKPVEDLELWKWTFKKMYPGATIEYPEDFCPHQYYKSP